MGLFFNRKKAEVKTQEPPLATHFKFDVAGFYKYVEAAKELYELNPQYKNPKKKDKAYYKYKYFEKPCALVPEPSNEYDQNAVAVYCNDVKVGYAPSGLHNLLKRYVDAGYFFTLTIRAGVYKEYDEEEDDWVIFKKEPYAFVDVTQVPK